MGDDAKLGDILGEPSGAASPSAPTHCPQPTEAVAESCVVNAARLAGVDPAEALDEFRRDGALAQVLRGLIGLGPKPEKFWEVVSAMDDHLAQGETIARAADEVSRQLSERDAVGVPRRPISAATADQYYREARAWRNRTKLARLFVGEDWQPPRKDLKG